MPTQKITWQKIVLFGGVQTIWTTNISNAAGAVIGIEIVKDRREKIMPDYPYALHVAGSYEGHYKTLNLAKKEGVKKNVQSN